MSKHTPGPWKYTGTLAGTPTAVMHPNGSIQLAHALTGRDLDGTNINANEADANARLIAAAPDLLEACRAALAYLEKYRPKGNIRDNFHQYNDHENGTVKPLRAAIARAEGGGA